MDGWMDGWMTTSRTEEVSIPAPPSSFCKLRQNAIRWLRLAIIIIIIINVAPMLINVQERRDISHVPELRGPSVVLSLVIYTKHMRYNRLHPCCPALRIRAYEYIALFWFEFLAELHGSRGGDWKRREGHRHRSAASQF